MNPSNGVNKRTQRGRGDGVRSFLDRLYWVLGCFLVAWSVTAVVCIYRRKVLDLPIFGAAQISEAIIFTLIVFSVLLPCLLYIIGVYRGAAALRRWPSRYPGVPQEEFEIPASFAWLRVGVFILLVCAPAASMQLCYWRMVGTLTIEWNNEVLNFQPLKGAALFSFPKKPDPTAEYSNWRWRGNDAPGDIPRAKMTAAPGWEPWIFTATSFGSLVVALWFLFTPAGILRKWLRKSREAAASPAEVARETPAR